MIRPIKDEEVISFLNIEEDSLLDELYDFIKGPAIPTYYDNELQEHLYSIENLYESYGVSNLSEEAKDQIQELQTLMDKYNAGYFRIPVW